MGARGKLQLKRRIGLGLAALALALQAFWPLIAQARPRNITLVPLCTVDGVTHYVEVPGGQTPAEERTAKHGDHCAFCLFGSDRVIAAPTLFGFFAKEPEVSADWPVRDFLPKAIEEHLARPRAPPFFSFVPQANDESRRTNEEASMLGG
ncbi:MAG: DUF2946 family protein, partial [Clostridia bacterium]